MEATHRSWRRLHFSTWLLLIAPAAILASSNIPGEYLVVFRRWYTNEIIVCEHGWPLVWLVRQGLHGHTPSVWALSRDVCRFNLLALIADMLVALALLAVAAAGLEWRRRRRRHRLCQISVADMLLTIAITCGAMAYIADRRNTIARGANAAPPSGYGDRAWEIAIPTWLRDWLPRRDPYHPFPVGGQSLSSCLRGRRVDAQSVYAVAAWLGLVRPAEQCIDLPDRESETSALRSFIELDPERVWVEVPTEVQTQDGRTLLAFEPAALRSLTNLRHLLLTRPDDLAIACLESLPELRSLVLYDNGTEISAEAASHLRKLDKLRSLRAPRRCLGDAGISAIASLANLECLELTGATSADFHELAKLSHLRFLMLPDTTATDDELAPLAAISGLEQLELAGHSITGVGLSRLAGLRRLRTLRLGRCGLTDDGLIGLAQFSGLIELALNHTPTTGRGLPHLAGLLRLRLLDLSHTEIDDSGLAKLPDFARLADLDLSDTRITAHGISRVNRYNDLSELRIKNTRVAHLGMLDLTALPKLSRVECDDSWLDRRECVRLRAERPALAFFQQRDRGPQRDLAVFQWQLKRARKRAAMGMGAIKMSVVGPALGDEQLLDLRGLTALERLHLNSSRVTDAGLALLTQFERLREIDLADTQIGDASLATLSMLPALEHLDISYTEVSSDGIIRFLGLPRLKNVGLDPSQVTLEVVAELRRRPGLRMVLHFKRAPWGRQYRGADDFDEFLRFLRDDLPESKVAVKGHPDQLY